MTLAYFVDSNVFIEGNNRHYGIDFCPAFWDWLAAANQAKKLFSLEKVRDELVGKKDAVSTWAAAAAHGFFVAPNAATVLAMQKISPWLVANYEAAQAAVFMARADYYLVAEALARGGTVVTHEVHNEGAKKVKIPTVCKAFGVDCCNPFQMLRKEKASFVLLGQPAIKIAAGAAAATQAAQARVAQAPTSPAPPPTLPGPGGVQ